LYNGIEKPDNKTTYLRCIISIKMLDGHEVISLKKGENQKIIEKGKLHEVNNNSIKELFA
jgi:hypothetical protein